MKIFTAQPDSTTNPNVLIATASDLSRLLQDGKASSVQLVDLYLSQIEGHNHRGLKLNAMISTAPKKILLDIARYLDNERAAGHIRGPLHGISVTVKGNICTDVSLGMDTTCGSYALVGSVPQHNAPIVNHVGEVLAPSVERRAKMSSSFKREMSGWKGFGITTGWSAAPAGSSSGSASGVAAGFASLAIATETDGSITQPANRAALFGIKVTVGRASTEGTAPWSALTGSVGSMAKSAQDFAYLVDVILGTNTTPTLNTSWKGQTVGFVDDILWGFSEFICTPDPVLITQREAYMDTKRELIEHGATLHEKVPLTSIDELQLDGDDALDQLCNHDYAKAWEKFLKNFPSSSMKSIADVVKFNKLNAKVTLPAEHPGQQLLESALEDKMPEEKYAEGVSLIREAAKTNGIDKTIHQFGPDVIVGPMDGRIPTIAAAAGCPVGTVPLGYSQTNGRPFGLAVVALANEEHKILQFMTAWDEFTPSHLPPPQLMDWNSPEYSNILA
ncbi:hypothetical protein BCON_0004g00650 [Botryotinia convoluta]|uniref:Amidase domain-containing protein n=1 Tax=Botryotinia convoluta TaxID=54673 RepID=A0A4Z1IUD0_9HELO|nr:hypothetical protein BCON_0004g00650 [Botryotinia convoluta]